MSEGKSRDDEQADGPKGAWRRLIDRLPRGAAKRADLLRRDLGMVVRTLKGHHPSPVVRDHHLHRADVASKAVTSGANRPLRVEEVIVETKDAITLMLSDPSGRYVRGRPGQFLTLYIPHEGQVHRRAYSLSDRPMDAPAQITIKRVAGGLISNLLCDWAEAGTLQGRTFDVRGPSGVFIADPRGGLARRLVLIAGGSGITPMRSILEEILAIEDDARIALIYGNRVNRDVIFADRLRGLADGESERFRLLEILQRPPKKWKGLKGVMDEVVLADALDRLEPWLQDEGKVSYMICGPEPVLTNARALLAARGVDEAQIQEERFGSPDAEVEATDDTPHEVVVRLGDETHTFMTIPGRTVLEAASEADVPLAFSCTLGGCGACRMRLVRGEVSLVEPNCLTDAERSEGLRLLCVATACGPLELEEP